MRPLAYLAVLIALSLALLKLTGSPWWALAPFIAVVVWCVLILVVLFFSYLVLEQWT